MKYDVIGDIHGQAMKLEKLLSMLGYRKKGGAFSQHGHQAVFLGDFIDRGPAQLETIKIVRTMVESQNALAIMGNHEYNAIAWHTPDPLRPSLFLRTRIGQKGNSNRAHHSAFLSEFELLPELHADVISWFRTLPLWLDLAGFRVVHACWHHSYISKLDKILSIPQKLSECDFIASCRSEMEIHAAVNAVIKGVELSLPDGVVYKDKNGKTRNNYRTAWWIQSARTLNDIALVDENVRDIIPNSTLDKQNYCAYDNLKPIFFGHYWMNGRPRLQSPKIACLDYSGEPNNPIVAYRWDGEETLSNENFVCCP